MRQSQSAVARRVATPLLTLSLVALGVGPQWFGPQFQEAAYNAESSRQGPIALVVRYVSTATAVAAGAVMWLITRGDPDHPDSTPHVHRSDPWRPLPQLAQTAFDERFDSRPDPLGPR